MYYHRSRSPSSSRYSEGRSNYSRGLSSYNSFNADLALSSYMPRNRSVQRVMDTDFARPERSRSPMRDYTSSTPIASSLRTLPSPLSVDSSPMLKRRELGLTSNTISDSRSSPVSWLGGDDYTLPSKPRSYYDFPSTSSSRYTSYSSTSLRRPQRIDYSDYFRPILTTRPVLKSNYTPRPRAERESAAMPIVRERKLIKFRETAKDILGAATKRKISWDLPEEIDSPLINEMRAADASTNEISTIDSVRSRDSSLTRYESKEASPRNRSLTRYDSKDCHSRDGSLTHTSSRRDSGSSTASASRRSSDHSVDRMSPRNLLRMKSPRKSNLELNDLGITEDPKMSPIPPKTSIAALPKSKKHRKPSIESSEEKRLKHSLIADKIRRGQESPDNTNSLVDNLITQKSDALNNDVSKTDKYEQELSHQAEISCIPDIILTKQDDRNQRRRRDYVSEAYSEQDKLEENARSRCRSRVKSTQDLASHSQNTVVNSESEAVRPINRVHRKSVKYKMEQPSNSKNSKFSKDSRQGSATFSVDNAKEPLEEFRKENVSNLTTIDQSKLQQKVIHVDSNETISNEVSQYHIKEKTSKESLVDKVAAGNITVESKEQICPVIDLAPTSKQTKAKKVQKKDVIKGETTTNKVNNSDINSSNEKKVDPALSVDTQNKQPGYNDANTESKDKNSISKHPIENKNLSNNFKKDEITKLPQTIGTNTTKEADSKRIPDLLKKSPSVKPDTPEISDTKKLATKLQPCLKNTLVNKPDNQTDKNISIEIATPEINSKTSSENKYFDTHQKSNSQNLNKVIGGVEPKASILQQSSSDNVTNKLASSNIKKDIVISAIDDSKNKSKLKPSNGSELKDYLNKDEAKISGASEACSNNQTNSLPSITNKSNKELDSKGIKTNTKANKWSKEPDSEINGKEVLSSNTVGVKIKNSQLTLGIKNQLPDISNTDNSSNNTKISQFSKGGSSSASKCESKLEKTESSQTNCPDVLKHIDTKSMSGIADKRSNTSSKDKLLNADNKKLDAQDLKSNKISAPGSIDGDKISVLPQSLKCTDTKNQTGFKHSNILKDKTGDNTTDDKTLGVTKSRVLEKNKSKDASEPIESNKLTHPEQDVLHTGIKQLDTKNMPSLVSKQLVKTNTKADIVNLPLKNIKVKPTSEILDTNKISISENKDQGEIVVVCKLPPPPKKESISIKHEIPDNIPIDQSLVVSLRKSTKLHVLSKHFDPIGKNKSRALPIIPNQHAFPVPKEAAKSKNRPLASVNEETEINAPVFPEVVDQKQNISDQTINTKIKLKSIPDVIQSSIKTNSQTVTQTIDEQPLVLPNIKDGMNEKSSVDIRKPDILNVKKIVEEPLNKFNTINKASIGPTKTVESQVKSNSEKTAISNEIKDKLPPLTNNKDNSTCIKKSDALLPNSDLPNKKQINLKNIKIEQKPETKEVLPNESGKSSAKNVLKIESCHSEIDNKNISSDLSKSNALKEKKVNKELETKEPMFTNESTLKVKHPEQKSKLNSDVIIPEQQSKSKGAILDGKMSEQTKFKITNSDKIGKSDVEILKPKKSIISDGKTSDQTKSTIVHSDVKVQEQQTKLKITNSDAKITGQYAKSVIANSDKILEQKMLKVVNSDGITPEQAKSKIVNSDVKVQEQQTKSIVTSLDVKVQEEKNKTKVNLNEKSSEQTKLKSIKSDVKIPEQNKSKTINSDIKVPEQTKSKTINSDVKIPEQSNLKTFNSDLKIPEQTKSTNEKSEVIKDVDSNKKISEKIQTKVANENKNISEQQIKTNANSDVKTSEQKNKLTVHNSAVKPEEQQLKSTITNSEAKLPEQQTRSKCLISDKLSKKEDNVDKVTFKDTESYIKKADLSLKTSKPANESSRPYKRSVTTPNVDTILDSSSPLKNVDNETNRSLPLNKISKTLSKANNSLSNNELLKSSLVKDVTIAHSKEKVVDKYTLSPIELKKTDKNIPGQSSQQLINDNQRKNAESPLTHVSDSLSIKESFVNKTVEDNKINAGNINVTEKVPIVNENKKENIVDTKNKKFESRKAPLSEAVKTSDTEKVKDKIVTSKDKVLSPGVENSMLHTSKEKTFKDENLSTMKSSPQSILCSKTDKSLKLKHDIQEEIKNKNEIISVKKVDSLKEKEKVFKPSDIQPFDLKNKSANKEACSKIGTTFNDNKANCIDKSAEIPNSNSNLNSKATKVMIDLPNVNTAKLSTVTNADPSKPIISNSLPNSTEFSTNSVSNKSTNEMTKVNVLPKNKTPKIKENIEQDVNGNSPGTVNVLNVIVTENKTVCDAKTTDTQTKIEIREKDSAANLNVDINKAKTLADKGSETISVHPSPTNENTSVSKQKIPPPEVLNYGKASATDTNKIEKPKESEKKVTKVIPPPVPAPRKWGLCFRYHEPIRESSSSDDSDESDSETSSESSYSSETETPRGNARYRQDVSRRNLLDNGKTSPDRPEKIRTQLSNASVTTTVTNVSVSSYDDSPKKLPTITQKLKFRPYSIDDFVFLKLLGKGSFGKVLLAELKNHGMHFAIKCLKKDVVLEDDDVESTMIERKILRLGTQHPYMCKLYCTFQTKSYLFFVMEYLNGGDLMFHIQQKSPFEVKRAMFYGAEIVSALKFLHKRGIIYRDIKLDNILLDLEGHVHLVDFGMCKTEMLQNKTSTFCGTPDYIPPEIILGKKYNQSVDWWSFGILLFEMLAGRSPFVGTDEDELFWSICNEEPFYPRFLPKDAKHILENFLIKTPNDRLGMPTSLVGEVEDHPFFSTISWEKLEKKQIPPPFKPTVLSASDTGNFDRSFTMDSPTLSPVDSDILESMDQEQFQGFSYTNPHITG